MREKEKKKEKEWKKERNFTLMNAIIVDKFAKPKDLMLMSLLETLTGISS